jgi:hypothetical protein
MNPDNLRNEISRHWSSVNMRPTTVYAMHPDGHCGYLASISLHEHESERVWLHFRTDGDGVQCAQAEDAETLEPLEWDKVEVENLDTVLRGFVENFESLRFGLMSPQKSSSA